MNQREQLAEAIRLMGDMKGIEASLKGCEDVRAQIRDVSCRNHSGRKWFAAPAGEGPLCDQCFWTRERMTMIELVQRGEGEHQDLMIWSMGNLQEFLRKGAPKDTIVYYYNGSGTSKYENPPSIEAIANQFPAASGDYKTVTLAGWSAGGRAVQRQLDNWWFRNGRSPQAVLIADGLYGSYLPGTKEVVLQPLQSIVAYARIAAAEEKGRVCILWHSSIPTPGYASSAETINAIRAEVERSVGPLEPYTSPTLDGRPIKSAFRKNGLVILEYAGTGKEEHIAEAHMIDEVMREFCPWFSDDNSTIPDDYVYFPNVIEQPAPSNDKGFGERVLMEAQALLLAGVKETAPNDGPEIREMLAGVGVSSPNNWCAAFVAYCIREAEKVTGQTAIVKGCAGAKATMAQFQQANRWIPKADLPKKLARGMVVVWHRGPVGAWTGHIGIVKEVLSDGTFRTIEGNSGPNADRVAEMLRRIDDPNLLGAGVL